MLLFITFLLVPYNIDLTIIRPNLTHSVNSLKQFLHGPIKEPFKTVKHILLYVKGTLYFGLTFTISIVTTTTTYSDVEWTGCPNTCCFTLGYSIYLGYNIVYWSTKKQLFVSWSSYEFEYRTLATTAVKFFGCNIVSWSTYMSLLQLHRFYFIITRVPYFSTLIQSLPCAPSILIWIIIFFVNSWLLELSALNMLPFLTDCWCFHWECLSITVYSISI